MSDQDPSWCARWASHRCDTEQPVREYCPYTCRQRLSAQAAYAAPAACGRCSVTSGQLLTAKIPAGLGVNYSLQHAIGRNDFLFHTEVDAQNNLCVAHIDSGRIDYMGPNQIFQRQKFGFKMNRDCTVDYNTGVMLGPY